MQLIQLETIEVPFRKLVASTANVRTTPAEEEATPQLAASIQALGLLQSLVVQPAARGKFAVIAGARRYSALTLLHEAGQIPQSYKVPCCRKAPTQPKSASQKTMNAKPWTP